MPSSSHVSQHALLQDRSARRVEGEAAARRGAMGAVQTSPLSRLPLAGPASSGGGHGSRGLKRHVQHGCGPSRAPQRTAQSPPRAWFRTPPAGSGCSAPPAAPPLSPRRWCRRRQPQRLSRAQRPASRRTTPPEGSGGRLEPASSCRRSSWRRCGRSKRSVRRPSSGSGSGCAACRVSPAVPRVIWLSSCSQQMLHSCFPQLLV